MDRERFPRVWEMGREMSWLLAACDDEIQRNIDR